VAFDRDPLTDKEREVLMEQFQKIIFLSPEKSAEQKKREALGIGSRNYDYDAESGSVPRYQTPL
jgi:hypothetical protein